jgi:hypothetical protein
VERQGSNNGGTCLQEMRGKCGGDSNILNETEIRGVIQVGAGMERGGVVLDLSIMTSVVMTTTSMMYD